MTAQPEEFLGQTPEWFLAQSPEDFLDTRQFSEGVRAGEQISSVERRNTLLWIALAIAAAMYAHHRMVVARLREESADSQRDLREAMSRIWPTVLPAWRKMVAPAVMHAYRLGTTSDLSYPELEALATAYADRMGEYVTSTSTDAMVEGFNAQINSGWDPRVAAMRAKESYGLDSQSMRQAVRSFVKGDPAYSGDIIPAAVRTLIDRLIIRRGELLGDSEAYAAVQMAKALTWQFAYKSGQMPADAMKMWITARDERVCPVCGPMDRQMVPPDEYFTSGEQSFFAPGVHPRCRCRIEIVYTTQFQKAMPGDPYDRNRKGQFARTEQRKRRVTIRRKRQVDPDVQRLMSELRARTQEEQARPSALSPNEQGLLTSLRENSAEQGLLTSLRENSGKSSLSSTRQQESILSSTAEQQTEATSLSSLSSTSQKPKASLISTSGASLKGSLKSTETFEGISEQAAQQALVIIAMRKRTRMQENEPVPAESRPPFENSDDDVWLFYDDYAKAMSMIGVIQPRITIPGEIINFADLKDALDYSFKDMPESIRPPIIGYRSELYGLNGVDIGLHESLIDSREIARARLMDARATNDLIGSSGARLQSAYREAREMFEDRLQDIIFEDEDLTDEDILSFYGDAAPPMTGEALREQFYLDLRRNTDTADYLMEQYKIYVASDPNHMANVLDLDADMITWAALSDWLIPVTASYSEDSSQYDDGAYMPTVLRIREPRSRTGEYMTSYVEKVRPVTPMELDPNASYEVVNVQVRDLDPDDDMTVYLMDNIYRYRVVTLVPLYGR